jgi:curved DNA-binding protein CbpA
MINYYATLGVLPTSSLDEIRASFRQLVKRYHPDMRTGNAAIFARIREAYETLSEPEKREQFDAAWTAAHTARVRIAGPSEGRSRTAALDQPVTVLTRIMSLALPRSGRFQLEGIIGRIQIEPTTPETLWDTTLRKFQDADPEKLAQHVIQVRLSGEKDLVQTIMPRPTDYGVELQKATPEERRKPGFLRNLLHGVGRKLSLGDLFEDSPFGSYGAFLPLSLIITVPRGIPLVMRNVTGTLSLGDLRCDLVANMLGGVLRATHLTRASLTLNGSSRAYLSKVDGPADLLVFGDSQLWLNGNVTRLRAVVENRGQIEVHAPVAYVQAEVRGNGLLNMKESVGSAHCDVRDNGYVRIARVRQGLQGTRAGNGRVDAAVRRRPGVSPNPAHAAG